MAYITYDDLPTVRQQHKDETIVLCTGTFDLTHAEHVLFFEACKKLGDILVVAIGDDATIHAYKGPTRPIYNEQMRMTMVHSFKSVDYVLLDTPDPAIHKIFVNEIMFEKLKPDIYAVNYDAFNMPYRHELARRFNVRLVDVNKPRDSRFPGLSTSELIEQIKLS